MRCDFWSFIQDRLIVSDHSGSTFCWNVSKVNISTTECLVEFLHPMSCALTRSTSQTVSVCHLCRTQGTNCGSQLFRLGTASLSCGCAREVTCLSGSLFGSLSLALCMTDTHRRAPSTSFGSDLRITMPAKIITDTDRK